MKSAILSAWTLAALAAFAKPILVINEDNDHYFKLSSELMNEASLKAYAHDIFRGHVTHFFMCAQGQRASFDSKVWEPIWAGLDDPNDRGETNNIWCVNAKKLFDAGIDPYKVWIGCAREKGVSPWMTMRMNDVHFCTTTNYFRNTTFYKTHPEWRCVPGLKDGLWEKFCMDYSVREVYDYHLAMAKELIDRYDVDGLELDFLRFSWYFRPGERRSKANVLTAFIRDVRAHAEAVGVRRGRKILVGARVPALPVVCATMGMETEKWAKERLIDWLVVCNQYGCTDFALPFVEWRDRMKAIRPDLVLLPGCDHKLGRNGRDAETMTAALYRGWADGLYAQGAEGLYLFNLPYNPKRVRDAVYGEGLAPETVARGARRCPATRHDVMPKGGIEQATLPLDLKCDRLVPLTLGTVPKRTGEVYLVFDRDDAALKDLTVLLNGEAPCRPPREVPVKDVAWTGGKRALAFAFDPVAFVPRVNGVLIDALPGSAAKVVWCEIRISE